MSLTSQTREPQNYSARNSSARWDNPPKVSLGIPVYNGERFLRQTLDICLGQTYPNLEIVVSDNASTDSTESIVREYQAKDDRIRYERQEKNRGAAWNFNRVFGMATGKYFKWAASDDLFTLDYVEKAVAVLESDPEVVWVHSKACGVLENATLENLGPIEVDVVSLKEVAGPSRSDTSPSARFRAVLFGPIFCTDCSGIFRREQLAKTGLERPFYGSEKVMLAECALLGRYEEIDEVLFFRRSHPTASNMLKTIKEQQIFTDPDSRANAFHVRWGLFRGYMGAICSHPLRLTERIRCLSTLLAYLIQIQKWGKVLKQIFVGRSMAQYKVQK